MRNEAIRWKKHTALLISAILLLQMWMAAAAPGRAYAESEAAGREEAADTVGGKHSETAEQGALSEAAEGPSADVLIDRPGGASDWYLTGSFQGWNNSGTSFAHLVGEFYAISIVLDAGTHEFKLTKNGTWDGFSNNGNNFSLTLTEASKVNVYINDELQQARISVPGVEGLASYAPTLGVNKWPRLVGSIQTVFQEPEWSPSEAGQLFVDYYFNNTVYKLQAAIPAGRYEAKAAFGADWEESYGYNGSGDNLSVVVLDSSEVTFSLDYSAQERVLTHDYKPVDGQFDGMIRTDRIQFDSRSATFKKPFGAIAEGQQPLTLRIAAKKDDVQAARVELSNAEALASTFDMRKVTSVGELDYFETIIPGEVFRGIGVWGYKFILIDGPAKVEFGDDGQRGGTGSAADEGAVPFELTVYDANFHTPDWMKNAVVYQIFPDRFFDGETSNNRAKLVDGYRGDRSEDRTGEEILPFPLQYFDGGVEGEPAPDQVWGEWSDIPEMPDRLTPENKPYFPDSTTDGIWTNEFYGGDIQGVEAKLNYLESIGVTAIYFNPVAWAGSNHKYDATDYKHLDPMFGEPVYHTPGDPKSGLDYKATRIASDKIFIDFAGKARERGIHIITDGVFNHVGDDSIYFDRYEKYPEIGAYEYWAKVWDHVNDDDMTQAQAEQAVIDGFIGKINPATGTNYKYPEDFEFTTWFTVHNQKVLSRDNAYMYKYDSWWGYDSLPAMDAVEPAEGDEHGLEGLHEWNVQSYREHVIGYDLTQMNEQEQQAAMQHTASQRWNWMGASGWRLDVAPDVSFGTWEKFREAVKSQTGLANANGRPIDDPIILGEEWGVATHYLLGNQFDSVMNYRFRAALQSFLTGGSAESMHAALESIREDYPKEAWLAMLNLVGSHDTTRNITKLDHPEYEENRIGIAEPATDKARKLQELTAIFQMGYPGAPMIYYGDEVGLEGTKDPDSRRTFPWERVAEENGAFSGTGSYASLFGVYQKAADIRHSHGLFRTGDIKAAYAAGSVIAYARKQAGEAGLVVINKGNSAATIEADVAGFLPNGLTLVDRLYGTAQSTVAGGKLALTIPALTGFMMTNDGVMAEVPGVSGLNATAGDGKVALSWQAVAEAEGYNVYRAPIEGGALTLLASGQTDTAYEDREVANGTKYYYAVTAAKGSGESEMPDMVAATPHFPVVSVAIEEKAAEMTIGVGRSTSMIVVAIASPGLTDAAEHSGKPAPGLTARLGYYPDGTDKAHALETKLRYKEDGAGGVKLYEAAFEPTEAGSYRYFARASTDNGETYTLSAEEAVQTNADSADTSAPAAPTLEDIPVESNLTRLAWTAGDEESSGFEIWRKTEPSGVFVKIAALPAGPDSVTSYTDYLVSNDVTYTYKVAAFDQSYNRSYSEEKTVTPKLVMVDVTLRLHIPAYTPAEDGIFLAGSLNGWNAGGNELKVPSGATSRDVVEYTFKMMAGKTIQYKYTRGSWETEAFTSHARVPGDKEDMGNWAYSSTDTNMNLTIKNQGGNRMVVNDYVLRWVDMPMMIAMPRISYGEDIAYTAAANESSFTLKAVVPFGVSFTINGEPLADGAMDAYGHVQVDNIPLKSGENKFVLHIEPTAETLAQPWFVDKGRASQATKTISLTITKPGGGGGDSGTENAGGSGPSTPGDHAAVRLSPVKNAEGNWLAELPAGKTKLLVPAASEAFGENGKLTVSNGQFEAVIAGVTAEKIKAWLGASNLRSVEVAFSARGLSAEASEQLRKAAEEKASAGLKAAGPVYDFELEIIGADGKVHKVNSFEPPVVLTLKLNEEADAGLAGIYYMGADGSLAYAGGHVKDGRITANVTHFSAYGVLEYDKQFHDVAADYWAYDAIRHLSARHVVSGVSETAFAPLRAVTRAEFAAMLVRALALKAEGAAEFKDVDVSRWYAGAVAAAHEAGIVHGRSAEYFAPNALITRQEMAVMLMRAYALSAAPNGNTLASAAASVSVEFADGARISEWAREAIRQATGLGLLKGRSGTLFAPLNEANRAESVQAIAQLLKRLSS